MYNYVYIDKILAALLCIRLWPYEERQRLPMKQAEFARWIDLEEAKKDPNTQTENPYSHQKSVKAIPDNKKKTPS